MAREIVGTIEGAAIQSATINPVTLSIRRRRFILSSKGGIHQVFMDANECIHPGSMEMSITGCSLLLGQNRNGNTQKSPLSTWRSQLSIDPFCGGRSVILRWLGAICRRATCI